MNKPFNYGPVWPGMLGIPLLVFLFLPLVALVLASSPSEIARAFEHPMMANALALSVRSTGVSLVVIVLAGTPLSWWLARSETRWARVTESLVGLPIVIPPAVVGIALLEAYGRRGLLGPALENVGLSFSFTVWAVIAAQVMVSAPFFVQSAVAGFRRVDDDLLLVAQTLGASPARAFFRVALPGALFSLLSGAALAWARAVGEFGATLLFAGNLPGRTQTMPVAIYAALEADIGLARALAIVLGGAAFGVLILMQLVSPLLQRTFHLRPGRPEAIR